LNSIQKRSCSKPLGGKAKKKQKMGIEPTGGTRRKTGARKKKGPSDLYLGKYGGPGSTARLRQSERRDDFPTLDSCTGPEQV